MNHLSAWYERHVLPNGLTIASVRLPGFRTAAVDYVRESRVAGSSSFNGWRLWNLAVEGITGFSITPLRIWSYMGLAVAGVSLAWGTWILVRTLIFGHDIPGYASLFVAVTFLGGLQLIGIGIVGEYVGRIQQEVRRRPRYRVSAVLEAPRAEVAAARPEQGVRG